VQTTINICMNSTTVLKVMMYLFTTILIGIATQLGELRYDFDAINNHMWIGIIIKATLPGLISIKALFDTLPKPE
jgi:hypothetical protein